MISAPIKRTDEAGVERWWLNGKLHREDGPAFSTPDGTEMWFFTGKCHREGGPAITRRDNLQKWYKNNNYHREDGPAVLWASGDAEWWIDGVPYSFTDFINRPEVSPEERVMFMLRWGGK